MMLSAATSMINDRIANITLLSTASASKKLRLSSRQSVSIIGRCCAGSIAGAIGRCCRDRRRRPRSRWPVPRS